MSASRPQGSSTASEAEGNGSTCPPGDGLSGVAGGPEPPHLWRSFHLFYHEDQDRLLLELIRPLVASLWCQGQIDGFFFVRYPLGGSHIRLRLRVAPEQGRALEAVVAQAAEDYFARRPSRGSLDVEKMRRDHETALATDGYETDPTLYADNSLRGFPFDGEVERWGGQELVHYSRDFFTLSSCHVLQLLGAGCGATSQARLTAALPLLVRLAWGAARDEKDFLTLLEYPSRMWKRRPAPVIAHAEMVFRRKGRMLRELLLREIEVLERLPRMRPTVGSPEAEGEAALRLARAVAAAPERSRRWIVLSHLHMASNRLGLSPPEEVYAGALLGRAARDLSHREPGIWKSMKERLAQRRTRKTARLEALIDPTCDHLASKAGHPYSG